MNASPTTAELTRREAREIERRTGVRPVAIAPTRANLDLAAAVAADFRHDTGRIERNAVASLVSVVPTEIIDRSAVAAARAELPAAFGGPQADERGMTVRAAKPASLVAKRRRRVASGFAAAASAAAVATTGLLIPAAQAPAADAAAASQADLLAATHQDGAEGQAGEHEGDRHGAPEVQRVITAIHEAPAEVADRTWTDEADAVVEAAPAPAPATTAGGSSDSSADDSDDSSSGSSSSSASTGTSTSGSTSTVAAAPSGSFLETALQFEGYDYVLGGNSPSTGFDCSGLVSYVLQLHGIDAPQSTPGIAALGTVIPESEAQPGDIVIYPGIPHVGFYAGPGTVFSAVDYGEGVRYGSIDWADHYIVRI
ncbi:putative endopeptidase p60 [Pseudoclavibacter triregionum]|nr:putative endopeptidase p60 [Pseudoclavibacter triregionum]